MKICYFHGQLDGLEPIKYLFFLFMSYEQGNCTLSQEKENVHMFVHSSIQTKKVEYERLRWRAMFRTLSNIYDGAFLRKHQG